MIHDESSRKSLPDFIGQDKWQLLEILNLFLSPLITEIRSSYFNNRQFSLIKGVLSTRYSRVDEERARILLRLAQKKKVL